jgi:hypothetical protein
MNKKSPDSHAPTGPIQLPTGPGSPVSENPGSCVWYYKSDNHRMSASADNIQNVLSRNERETAPESFMPDFGFFSAATSLKSRPLVMFVS